MLAGLLGAIGLAVATIVYATWITRRAFKAGDLAASESKRAGELERAHEARGRAITERDAIITALQKTADRYKRASEKAADLAESALLASLNNPKDGGVNASAAIRSSLSALRELSSFDELTPTTMPGRPGPNPGADRGPSSAENG